MLKFRLGDALRFVIYHNERHIHQAKHMKMVATDIRSQQL